MAIRKTSPKKKPEAARPTAVISGVESGQRVDSRVLEERMQQAVTEGHRLIEVQAFGQHGIGGRLWKAGDETVTVRITGSPGQRVGSMGFPNTRIEVMGPASDDVGWLNAGARIVVHGQATNGIGNAMAQALGLGVISEMSQAQALIRDGFPIRDYKPKDRPAWEAAYQRFAAVTGA